MAIKLQQIKNQGAPVVVGQLLRSPCSVRVVRVVAVRTNCPLPYSGYPNYTQLTVVSVGRHLGGIIIPTKVARHTVIGQLEGQPPRPIHMGVVCGIPYRVVNAVAK